MRSFDERMLLKQEQVWELRVLRLFDALDALMELPLWVQVPERDLIPAQ